MNLFKNDMKIPIYNFLNRFKYLNMKKNQNYFMKDLILLNFQMLINEFSNL